MDAEMVGKKIMCLLYGEVGKNSGHLELWEGRTVGMVLSQ
jgi:hypothetical protein